MIFDIARLQLSFLPKNAASAFCYCNGLGAAKQIARIRLANLRTGGMPLFLRMDYPNDQNLRLRQSMNA